MAAFVGSRARIEVKWPNDVLIDRLKVSGSLIEVGEGVFFVGIGIYVASRPGGVSYPTACLRDVTGEDVAISGSARDVVARWGPLFDGWRAHGFGPLRDEYNSALHSVVRPVHISYDRDKRAWTCGLCRGVDEHGHLVLEKPDGAHVAHAAGYVEPAWS